MLTKLRELFGPVRCGTYLVPATRYYTAGYRQTEAELEIELLYVGDDEDEARQVAAERGAGFDRVKVGG